MKSFVLFICLCIAFANGTERKAKVPLALRRVMAKVTSLEGFLRALKFDEASFRERVKNFSIKQHSGLPGGPYLGKVALRSNSTEPSPDPVYLDNAPCKPRPEAVEVPQPEDKNALHFPLFVTLHRCRGACSERPFETRCEARETESLTLLASKVTWSSGSQNSNELEPDVAFLPVTNHTKCGCPCAVKPAECDNRTQVYSKENCRCECKLIQPSCPIRFQWNPEKCQCVCHPSENQKICSKRLQFDDKRCKCVCSSRRCKMKTKIRDPRDCRCKCPRFPKCPPGTVRDAQTCNCDWAPKKSRSEMSRGRRRL